MEVSELLSQVDTPISSTQGQDIEPLVGLRRVSSSFNDPSLPWQENDPIPDTPVDDSDDDCAGRGTLSLV